jgi:hypothetical protein
LGMFASAITGVAVKGGRWGCSGPRAARRLPQPTAGLARMRTCSSSSQRHVAEDGCLHVYGIDEDGLTALTDYPSCWISSIVTLCDLPGDLGGSSGSGPSNRQAAACHGCCLSFCLNLMIAERDPAEEGRHCITSSRERARAVACCRPRAFYKRGLPFLRPPGVSVWVPTLSGRHTDLNPDAILR